MSLKSLGGPASPGNWCAGAKQWSLAGKPGPSSQMFKPSSSVTGSVIPGKKTQKSTFFDMISCNNKKKKSPRFKEQVAQRTAETQNKTGRCCRSVVNSEGTGTEMQLHFLARTKKDEIGADVVGANDTRQQQRRRVLGKAR